MRPRKSSPRRISRIGHRALRASHRALRARLCRPDRRLSRCSPRAARSRPWRTRPQPTPSRRPRPRRSSRCPASRPAPPRSHRPTSDVGSAAADGRDQRKLVAVVELEVAADVLLVDGQQRPLGGRPEARIRARAAPPRPPRRWRHPAHPRPACRCQPLRGTRRTTEPVPSHAKYTADRPAPVPPRASAKLVRRIRCRRTVSRAAGDVSAPSSRSRPSAKTVRRASSSSGWPGCVISSVRPGGSASSAASRPASPNPIPSPIPRKWRVVRRPARRTSTRVIIPNVEIATVRAASFGGSARTDGDGPASTGQRTQPTPCSRASAITIGATRGWTWTWWCESRWSGRTPRRSAHSTWAVSSRAQVVGAHLPQREPRQQRRPARRTGRRRPPASAPARAGRAAGRPSASGAARGPRSGQIAARVSASSADGRFAIRLALVTSPARCASTMPRLTPRLIPKSSALTTRCRGVRAMLGEPSLRLPVGSRDCILPRQIRRQHDSFRTWARRRQARRSRCTLTAQPNPHRPCCRPRSRFGGRWGGTLVSRSGSGASSWPATCWRRSRGSSRPCRPAGRLLDVGCGHGLFANAAALGSPDRQVLGVDPSGAKIGVARSSSAGLPNVRYVQGTVQEIDGARLRRDLDPGRALPAADRGEAGGPAGLPRADRPGRRADPQDERHPPALEVPRRAAPGGGDDRPRPDDGPRPLLPEPRAERRPAGARRVPAHASSTSTTGCRTRTSCS